MPGRRHFLRGGRPSWLLVVASGVSCASPPVGYGLGPGPVGPMRVQTDDRGALIAVMAGVTGTGVKELPDGDLLLAGHGQTDFLERLSPQGKLKWVLQTCGTPGFATADDGAIYATAETFLDLDGQASDPAAHPPCPRPERHATRAMAAIPSTIVRMNGEGHTEWRIKTNLYGADLIAAGRLLFASGRPDDRAGHHEVIALTDWGQVGWKWEGSVATS